MSAKDIILKPIDSKTANELVRRVHYSGKVVKNSQIHIGVYYQGKLEGAMQFGPSLDKRKMIGLVEGTLWNEFIELNRMAFSEALPRNSESRAIGIAMRILKKHCPQLKWVISFADGTQCGDGTIYRASGFVLTSIKVNSQLWQAPESDARFSRVSLTDGKSHTEQSKAEALCRVTATKGKGLKIQPAEVTHSASLRPGIGSIETDARPGGGSSMRAYIEAGFKPLPGFQLRYIYFLDPTARERLTVPILPFAEIDKRGATMYRGVSSASVAQEQSAARPEQRRRCDSDPDAPSTSKTRINYSAVLL